MPHRKSRRMPASSGYIGAGNRSSEINKKARRPLQDLPEVYRGKTTKRRSKDSEEFGKEERERLRARLQATWKEEGRKRLWIIFISLSFGLLLLTLLIRLLRLFF